MLGSGIIKGLLETARNFFGSFRQPERLVTIEYPEQQRTVPENNRSFPFLVFDRNDPVKGLRCVSCKICEKECPPQCIYIETEKDSRGKPIKHPKVFDIDISVCMSCQICVEVCPFDSIKMDQTYELSQFSRYDALILHKIDLAKSNEYYHQIKPTEAGLVDEQLAAEREAQIAKAKAAAAIKVAPATASPTPKPPSPAPPAKTEVPA
jgi:NADH-quinone oxidoreductase subunit I